MEERPEDGMSAAEKHKLQVLIGTKILLVDDHEVVMFGMKGAIKRRWVTDDGLTPDVFMCETAAEAKEILTQEEIDIAVVDLRLKSGSGLEVARFVRDQKIPTRIVVYTSLSSPKAVLACAEIGNVYGIAQKDMGSTDILKAIEAARDGLSSLTPEMVAKAKEELVAGGALDRSLLTDKESRFADLVADGLSDAEIGEEMFLAAASVRNALSKMYQKLGIEGRNKLTSMVLKERPEGEALD